MITRSVVAALLGLAFVAESHAAAGEVLFALGRVEIQRGEATIPAARGMGVGTGDTVVTAPAAWAQLRFQDGALVALKPGTALEVTEYVYAPPPAARSVPSAPPAEAPAVAAGRSMLRLLKGALRTATGLIGKRPDDTYRVYTPAATIGIRGTDYGLAFCAADCPGHADGLYVGVSSGAIVLTNEVSEAVLRDGEYAYVKDSATPIEVGLEPPEVLEMPITADFGADAAQGSQAPGARSVQLAVVASGRGAPADPTAPTRTRSFEFVTEGEDPEGAYELAPLRTARALRAAGYAAGPVQAQPLTLAAADESSAGIVEAGAVATNLGFDPGTGLQWGRWTGGNVVIAGGTEDFSVRSLHWIRGPQASTAPVLPVTGTLSYTLVGNTDPTDQAGTTGQLTAINSSLTANFSAMTVTSTLGLLMNSQAWTASGTGSIASGTALFDGSYTSISIDAVSCGTCTGTFAGFFTGGAAAAGLGYSLTDGSTSISGAAAFGNPEPAP